MKNQRLTTDEVRSVAAPLASKALQKVASEAEKEAWEYITEWLTRLRLLDGVPFPYIVPSDGMLPNESIRFFHLDRNWLDALVDGALSTGVLDSRGSLADESEEKRQMLYNELMEKLNEKEIVHEPYRAGLFAFDKLLAADPPALQKIMNGVVKDTQDDIELFNNLQQKKKKDEQVKQVTTPKDSKPNHAPRMISQEKQNLIIENPELATKSIALNHLKGQMVQLISQMPFVTGGNLTGFLLRSSVVRDFPGIEVQAFEAPAFIGTNRSKAYNDQYRVELLKVKRLSSSIIMYIFNGLPSHLRIKEPSEGLRLGLEKDVGGSASFYMKYKNESGVQMTKTGVEYTSDHGVQDLKKIDLSTRHTTGDRSVINFSQCLTGPNEDGKFEGEGDGGDLEFGGFLATQLMQFPYEQDFEYDAIDQEPTSNQHARVNTEKIVFQDSTDVTFSRDPYGDD